MKLISRISILAAPLLLATVTVSRVNRRQADSGELAAAANDISGVVTGSRQANPSDVRTCGRSASGYLFTISRRPTGPWLQLLRWWTAHNHRGGRDK